MFNHKNKLVFFILFTFILSIYSCSSKSIHGNLPDAKIVSLLNIGKDNKQNVSKILGQPTFEGALGDNSYYYVGSVNYKKAFLDSKLKEQYILELNFDKSDILRKIYIYDENQTIDVAMSSLETETQGKKPSFFKQLLGNFGRPMGGKGPYIGSGKADD